MNERENELLEGLQVWTRRRRVTMDEMCTIMGHVVTSMHIKTTMKQSEIIQIIADRAKANLEAWRQAEVATAGGAA